MGPYCCSANERSSSISTVFFVKAHIIKKRDHIRVIMIRSGFRSLNAIWRLPRALYVPMDGALRLRSSRLGDLWRDDSGLESVIANAMSFAEYTAAPPFLRDSFPSY